MQKSLNATCSDLTLIKGRAEGMYDLLDYQVFSSSNNHYEVKFQAYTGLKYKVIKNTDTENGISFRGTKLPYKEEYTTQLQIEDYALAPVGSNYEVNIDGQIVSLPGCLYNLVITEDTGEVNCFVKGDERVVLTLDDNYEDYIFIGKVDLANIVVKDADYVVIRYKWTQGSDLDTDTRITNALTSDINDVGMGYYPRSSQAAQAVPVTPVDMNQCLMYWLGDNTGTGQESLMINVKNLDTVYNDKLPDVVIIQLKAAWWGTYGGQPTIEVDSYKGGTMREGGYREFVNDGGVLESRQEAITENIYPQGNVGSFDSRVRIVATIEYNKRLRTLLLHITPNQDNL